MARFAWTALVLSLAIRAEAQAAFVYNEAGAPMAWLCQANLPCMYYEVGMALERFDGAAWAELLRPSGQRALAKEGQCWRIPDRTRALGYRLRPNVYRAQTPQGLFSAVPVDCAAPPYPWAAPACPTVVAATEARPCASYLDVVDPGPAPPTWRGPRAPMLRP